MVALNQLAPPPPEGVVWDGHNDADIVALVERVAALHVWSPLEHTPFTVDVRTEAPHLGLSVINAAGDIVARVEEGNMLVFHLFRPGDDPTPLFVLSPDEVAAFYKAGA